MAEEIPVQAPPPEEATSPQNDVVNVIDPETQEVGSIPAHQLQDAISQGYQPASNDQAKAFVDEQKYGTTKQQLITGLEGAGKAATFGLSSGLERLAGVPKEDITGRAKVNPVAHGVGEAAGLVGSAFLGPEGAANILTGAGEGAAEAIGLGIAENPTFLHKVGSAAVKSAVETGIIQGGDEVSKMILQDPEQSVGTAVTNIGLSGLLGGAGGAAFGSISPLWKATMGKSTGSVLDAMVKKASGIESIVPDSVNEAIAKSGINVSPEVKAAMATDPGIKNLADTLGEAGGTSAGNEFQKSMGTFRKDASDQIAAALGKTPEDVANLKNMSEHQVGSGIVENLTNGIKEKFQPISEAFNKVRDKFSKVPLTSESDVVADRIAQLSDEQGWSKASDAPEGKLVESVFKDLPKQETLEDLRKYQSNLWSRAKENPALWSAVGKINGILREVETATMEYAAAGEGPEILATLKQARAAYGAGAGVMNDLAEKLGIRGYRGPESFTETLGEMNPEKILGKLSKTNDVGLINLLKEQFPGVAESIKDYHASDILRSAAKTAKGEEALNMTNVFKKIEAMSPELRDFVVGGEGQTKLEAIQSLLSSAESQNKNFSNTARAIDRLGLSKLPGSAVGMVAAFLGHNPLIYPVINALQGFVGRDAPDAIRLGVLKFLGSDKHIEAEGFKSMIEMIHNTMKGENLVGKATKNLFKSGAEVLATNIIPTAKDREKLDNRLQELQKDPSAMMVVGGKTGHYMPEHSQAIGETSMSAVNYLNSIRPHTEKNNPLDGDQTVNAFKKSNFDKALDIAEQPLVVMKDLQSGRITPQTIQHLTNLYPALYAKLKDQVSQQLMDTVSKGESIPYKTRLGLTLFLGNPMDSTMSQQGLMSIQSIYHKEQQPQQGMSKPPSQGSMKEVGKIPKMYQTQLQASEQSKLDKG